MFAVMAVMFVQLPPMAAKQDSVLNTYAALVEVDALAHQQYVAPIDGGKLVDGAIRGMMRELDPYSGYISPQELPSFERRSRGNFSGVGIELGSKNGQIMVIAPIEGSSAVKSGVLAGDVLISVDGREVEGRAVFDVEEMLVGAPGTKVQLRLQHPSSAESREVVLTRGVITLHTVRGFALKHDNKWDYTVESASGIAYLRVSSFRENTITDFDEALLQIKSAGARALILDLRFNPGGIMSGAVDMADRFLTDGVIVSTVSGRRAVDEYRATTSALECDLPLVILVNENTASSAEIVAGALQARGRARVVGGRSFGKGSVQHLIHLIGRKSAVKLTVALYKLPNGRIIHRTPLNAPSEAWGIKPDVAVSLDEEEIRQVQQSRSALDFPTSARGASRQIVLDRQLTTALQVAQSSID